MYVIFIFYLLKKVYKFLEPMSEREGLQTFLRKIIQIFKLVSS